MTKTSRPTEDRISPRVWRIAVVAALGPLLTNLDSTVVNVSLPTLGRDLHVGLDTLQWVVTGYLLALALMLPLSGWLVDRFGARRLYLACFTLFTAASVLCGISTSAHTLIAARVLQGCAGGLLAPLAQIMVAREAPQHIARVMGVMVIPVLLGPILGPSLAGLILQHASWHWIFLINLPIGIFALAMAVLLLPADNGQTRPRSLDLRGFLLLSPGLVLLLHSLEMLGTLRGAPLFPLIEFALALALLTAFGFHAARLGTAALIDLQLFRKRSFSVSATTQFLLSCIAFGGQILLPLYLINVLHVSTTRAGVLLGATGLGGLISYPSMGALTGRFGPRRVSSTGAAIVLLGTLPFALLPPAALSIPVLVLALFVRGLGLGAIGLPSMASAYSSIPRESIPVAATTLNILQRLGGPCATTALTLFLHSRLAALTPAGAAPRAYSATFLLFCAFSFAALLTALRLPLQASVRPGDPDLTPSAQEIPAE